MTAAEREFYEVTVDWLRELVRSQYGATRVGFLTREPERRLASSFHGFWDALIRNGLGPRIDSGPPPAHVRRAYEILGQTDTKYDVLKTTLDHLWQEDGCAKVLVFASFRPTIAYLSRRLRADGVNHQVIHGAVPMDPINEEKDERGRRVRNFLADDRCRVLLSTNIGGEGLDLQVASAVVNYDLPWNPSIVEQRIGRIDRFGQKRSVIHVRNVILPDTVEDLVFSRLLDRLQLFQDVVGDLAAIIGSIVRTLSTEFLSQTFSHEEAQRRLAEAEHRARNAIADGRKLLEREGEFIAYDQDFMDVIRDYDATGRTVRPRDIVQVCEGIIHRHFRPSFLRPHQQQVNEGADAIFELSLDFTLREMLRHRPVQSASMLRFLGRFLEDVPALVTFDGRVAEEHPEMTLLTSRHPFVRGLVNYSQDADPFHQVAAVGLDDDGGVEAGPGLLTLFESTLKWGNQAPRRSLIPFMVSLDGTILSEDASRRVMRIALDSGRSISPGHAPPGSMLERMFMAAQARALEHVESLANRMRQNEERRRRPRIAEIRTRFDRRIAGASERAAHARRHDDPERAARIDRYRKRMEREKVRLIERLTRVAESEEIIMPVGAAWIERG
jgi:hypothetical protein